MLQRVSLRAVLVKVLLWTFFFTSTSLSCNPGSLFGFERYNQKFSHSRKEYLATGTENISNPKTIQSGDKPKAFQFFELLQPKSELQQLTRKKRSGFGVDSVLESVTIIPKGLLESKPRGLKLNIRKNLISVSHNIKKVTASVSSDSSHAISSALTTSGRAAAKSFAKGSGSSQAIAYTTNDNKATANAEALAYATAGHGSAFSLSKSQANGISRAEATVINEHTVPVETQEVVTSNINDTNYDHSRPVKDLSNPAIFFDDPFFKPRLNDPFNRKENNSMIDNSPKEPTILNPTTLRPEIKDPSSKTENKYKSMISEMSQDLVDAQARAKEFEIFDKEVHIIGNSNNTADIKNPGTGISRTGAKVLEGQDVTTEIYKTPDFWDENLSKSHNWEIPEINFKDLFFSPGFINTKDKVESYVVVDKPTTQQMGGEKTPFQSGRTLDGLDIEVSPSTTFPSTNTYESSITTTKTIATENKSPGLATGSDGNQILANSKPKNETFGTSISVGNGSKKAEVVIPEKHEIFTIAHEMSTRDQNKTLDNVSINPLLNLVNQNTKTQPIAINIASFQSEIDNYTNFTENSARQTMKIDTATFESHLSSTTESTYKNMLFQMAQTLEDAQVRAKEFEAFDKEVHIILNSNNTADIKNIVNAKLYGENVHLAATSDSKGSKNSSVTSTSNDSGSTQPVVAENRPFQSGRTIKAHELNTPISIAQFDSYIVKPLVANTTEKNDAPDYSSATKFGDNSNIALAASESIGQGNAFSTSISQGNGGSRAEATVIEGHAVATAIHDIKSHDINDDSLLSPEHDLSDTGIDFSDPFFSSGFIDPLKIEDKPLFSPSTTEFDIPFSTTEVIRMPFQMGRTFGDADAQVESSEEQSIAKPLLVGSTFDEIQLNVKPSENTDLSSLVKQTVPVICEQKGNQTTWTCYLSFHTT